MTRNETGETTSHDLPPTAPGWHLPPQAPPPPLLAQAPPLLAQAPPLLAQAPPLLAQAPPLLAQAPPLLAQAPPSLSTQTPPPVDKPRWSRRKTLAVGAGTLVVAAVATVGIATATNSTSSSTATGASGAGGQGPDGQFGAQGQRGPGPGGQFGGPPGGRAGFGLGGALHGQFVVADGNGGYVTAEIQTGQVSVASATSITVVSSDGYTRSYTVGSSTMAGGGNGSASQVATGHTVMVQATVSGQTATATQIIDGGTQQQPGAQPGAQSGTGTTTS
jgi:hypothetical protein